MLPEDASEASPLVDGAPMDFTAVAISDHASQRKQPFVRGIAEVNLRAQSQAKPRNVLATPVLLHWTPCTGIHHRIYGVAATRPSKATG